MSVESVLAVACLISSGVVNTVINKYLVSNLRIKQKFFILAVQTGIILGLLGVINFCAMGYRLLLEKELLTDWTCIAFSLITMIYSGLQASEHLPISLFTILKNCTIPIVVLHDWMFFDYQLGLLIILSFVLIAVSSFIGTLSNRRADQKKPRSLKEATASSAVGLAWMLINCLSSASYSIRLSVSIKKYQMPSVPAALYTNLLAFPFLVALSLAEAASLGCHTKHLGWIALSGVTSCLIAVSTAWAAAVFSTTTMTMIAALNKTPTALSGIICGIEEVGSVSKWLSIALGVLSGVCYAASRSTLVYFKPVVQRLLSV